MRNNFFNILLIIAFIAILTKNEVYTSSAIEYVKYTKEHEKEAKKDMQTLVLSLGNDDFSEKYQDYTPLISGDTTKSDKIMHRIDKNLEKKYFSSDAQTTENIKRGEHMQNSALNLKSPINSRPNQHNFYADDQFIQLMKTLAIPKSVIKSRTGGNHNVNNSLRNGVNFVNVKPEVYPIFITEDEYGSKKIYNKDSVEISDQIHANNENKLIQLPNILDTEHKKLSSIRTATMPVTETLDLNELLKQLHINKGEVIVTKKEPKDNVQLNDFLNKFYSQSVNRMKFGNTKVNAHINELEDNIGLKDSDKSKTILLRNEVIHNEQLNANKRLEEIMEYLGFGKSLQTSYNTLYDADNPIKQGETSGRRKRSTNTQAGYTQDPDTCKTYNENLVILWSKLSKLINVTEQPNERALHNIALIIQAYLEHQNAKQPPETHRTKHEGLREIINAVMLKIRKLIGKNEGSAEKITKVIIKYLKPDYANAETEDCQQVNEEFLFSSVDLLYKNYLENTDCEDEDDNVVRSKTLTLMDRKDDPGKFNFGHTSLPQSNGDINPEIQTIVIENETYNDFQRGKVSRQRLTNEHRTVVKPNINKKPRHVHRSENQNGIEKSKSSSKSVNKKQKKSSFKSDGVKSKCEKYLTRKLIISLRPVMERFMERLECQDDNTLRSISFGEDSNPYYVYATKFYYNTPRLPTRNSGRQSNKSYKLRTDRHDNPIKHDQNVYKRDDENDYMWVRKYSFDQNRGMNLGKHAIHDTNLRESYTIKNTQQDGSSDDQETYNKYYQSPLLYNAYDGINKRHQVTNSNGFTSLINPAFSINDKKVLGFRSTHQKLVSSDIEQDEEKDQNEEKDFFPEELNDEYNFDRKKETKTDTIEIPFIDLTQLRNDDQLIEEKNNGHLKTFESIAEFLKMARDASVKTPEFAVPLALDTNKGYVELTHLIKYPKMLVYRPQFLVKNIMPYDDFLKTINNINIINDDVRLMKIVRHLPNNSIQVLFETEDNEAPLEFKNLNDRSGSSDPVVNHLFVSRMETDNENADMTDRDSEELILSSQNEVSRQFLDALDKLDNDEDLSPDLEIIPFKEEETPMANKYFDYNSDTNQTSNISQPDSTETTSWFTSLPNSTSSDSGQDVGQDSGINSAVGSQLGSGIQLGLNPALNLGLKPIHSSPLGSFFSKLLPSRSATQTTSNPRLYSKSHMNPHTDSSSGSFPTSKSYSQSNTDSLLPSTVACSNEKVETKVYSWLKSIMIRWWRKWKNVIKGEMEVLVNTMSGKPILWEKRAKYLDVIVDKNLTFREHIRTVSPWTAYAFYYLHSLLKQHNKLSLKCKLSNYTEDGFC